MLTEEQTRLIAAAVDGELSPAQDAAFRRLYAESAGVRDLYLQLLAHSNRLKQLPRKSAPPDLPLVILGRVTPIVAARQPVPPVGRRVGWLPYAVAASAILAVSAASAVWFAVRPAGPQDEPRIAQKSKSSRPVPKPAGRGPKPVENIDSSPEIAPPPKPVEPAPAVVAVSRPEAAPAPRSHAPDLIGAALLNSPPPLERVDVRLPFLAGVVELDRPDVQTRLADELVRDPEFRLDLFASDPHRGAEALVVALKRAGVTVSIDAIAQERIKKKLPGGWAVFTEALTAGDIGHIAATLAANDRGIERPVFGSAHFVPLRDSDRREIRDLLGADPGPWKRPKSPSGSAPGKPITAGTVDQITAALSKAKDGDKPALLLTFLPANGRTNPQASKEVREFLARQSDRKPGVVPLFITVRSPGS
jgi:hypothetical protein